MQGKPKETTDLGLYYFICLRAFRISLVSALKCDIHAILSAFLHVLHWSVKTTILNKNYILILMDNLTAKTKKSKRKKANGKSNQNEH